MRLMAKSGYRSAWGEWPKGKTDEVSDEVGAFLLRDSPGTFEVLDGQEEQGREAEGIEERLNAMSTETQTGLTAPDRRARGGRKRRA